MFTHDDYIRAKDILVDNLTALAHDKPLVFPPMTRNQKARVLFMFMSIYKPLTKALATDIGEDTIMIMRKKPQGWLRRTWKRLFKK